MRLFDAHNHLQDPILDPYRDGIDAALRQIGFAGGAVNGTTESDWRDVARLTTGRPELIPSFGLHPWYVRTRSPEWIETLTACLDAAGPAAAVGEIGMDSWIHDHDLGDQQAVMLAQLALAAGRNVPATIHCIQAWGALFHALRSAPLPERGFLLHAYGGPAEMVIPFAKLGAYFSFNPAHLAAKKAGRREIFRSIPAERLLVETDAPSMPPPDEYTRFPLPLDARGNRVNHPASLQVAYEELARLRGLSLDALCALVEDNFHRLFG